MEKIFCYDLIDYTSLKREVKIKSDLFKKIQMIQFNQDDCEISLYSLTQKKEHIDITFEIKRFLNIYNITLKIKDESTLVNFVILDKEGVKNLSLVFNAGIKLK